MKSNLSFQHYDIIETIYRFNPLSDIEEEKITPKVSLSINYENTERTSAALNLKLELGNPYLENSSFYLKATIMGIFSLEIGEEEGSNPEELEKFKDHMYKKNSLSILYPYMRSLVSDLTSKGSEPPILLPPINILSLLDENEDIEEHYPKNNNE